jgi:hypothetical protein
MKKYILVIIIILLAVFLLKNVNENMEINDIKPVFKSIILPPKPVKQGPDPYEGKLFSDVTLYNNDNKLDGVLGLEKCIKNCKGMCVEYGMTGDAYCFPKEYTSVKEKYLETIKNEFRSVYNNPSNYVYI